MVLILMFLVKKVIMELLFYFKKKLQNIKKDFIKDKLSQSRVITGEIIFKKKRLN